MSAALMVPTAVPAASTARPLAEVPGGLEVRPFGLAGAEPVVAPVSGALSGLHYDEDRQVTVTADGASLAENPLTMGTSTPTDTRYDNTTVTDNTVVD